MPRRTKNSHRTPTHKPIHTSPNQTRRHTPPAKTRMNSKPQNKTKPSPTNTKLYQPGKTSNFAAHFANQYCTRMGVYAAVGKVPVKPWK
jgi:hypothetical protein